MKLNVPSVKGLATFTNDIGLAEGGALAICLNGVIDKQDILSPRKGFKSEFNLTEKNITSLLNFKERTLVHTDDDKLQYREGDVTTLVSGTIEKADSGFLQSAEAGQSLFMCGLNGIKKLDSVESTIRDAGVVPGLEAILSLGSQSGSNWLEAGEKVAYKIVFYNEDFNGVLTLGTPSDRMEITNPSNGSTTSVKFLIPDPKNSNITGYQIYRAGTVSADAASGKNYKLIIQNTISNLVVYDTLASNASGATLYTNDGNIHGQPPKAELITTFEGRTLYANTETRHQLLMDYISLPSQVVVGGTTFTQDSTYNLLARQYTNVAELKYLINFNASADIFVNSLGPNALSFYKNDFTGAFSVKFNAKAAKLSTNDVRPSRIYRSKLNRPDSVERLSYIQIGEYEDARIIQMKEHNGILHIWTTKGYYKYGNTVITLIDTSKRLLARESVQILNDRLFSYTNNGLEISDGEAGSPDVSFRIKGMIKEAYEGNLEEFSRSTYGIAHSSDKKYILNIKENQNFVQYVYNIETNTFTKWDLNKKVGILNDSTDTLFYANDTNIVTQRSAGDSSDYQDESFEVTITSSQIEDKMIEVPDASLFEAGYTIENLTDTTLNVITRVTNVDIDASTITYDNDAFIIPDDGGTLIVNTFIVFKMETTPITASVKNMAKVKYFTEGNIFWKRKSFKEAELYFTSEISTNKEFLTLVGSSALGWGQIAYGTSLWGSLEREREIDTFSPPTNKQKCVGLSMGMEIKVLQGYFEYAGFSYELEVIRDKIRN